LGFWGRGIEGWGGHFLGAVEGEDGDYGAGESVVFEGWVGEESRHAIGLFGDV
jgi:hypothetical protein